jgi:hypothetical protein
VAAISVLLVSLGACGGGGCPTTTTIQSFSTIEFPANYGLGNINALTVYQGGFSGAGQTIAIIDTSCGFSDTDLANAVDFAVAQGATVINMSLRGAAPRAWPRRERCSRDRDARSVQDGFRTAPSRHAPAHATATGPICPSASRA